MSPPLQPAALQFPRRFPPFQQRPPTEDPHWSSMSGRIHVKKQFRFLILCLQEMQQNRNFCKTFKTICIFFPAAAQKKIWTKKAAWTAWWRLLMVDKQRNSLCWFVHVMKEQIWQMIDLTSDQLFVFHLRLQRYTFSWFIVKKTSLFTCLY